jgi:pyruvate/2-oxoglutarate dehydrogenase complex dihydrolipoamide acyltransferase (E2) component
VSTEIVMPKLSDTMFVTVSCDHRIIDGVMARRFLEELKTLLGNPIGLVVT